MRFDGLRIICSLLCLGLGMVPLHADNYYSQFLPGGEWTDVKGNPIRAEQGSVMFHKGVYYWYGLSAPDKASAKNARASAAPFAVRCYISSDLYNWYDKGIVFESIPDPDHDLSAGAAVRRPRVVFNETTGTFVMYFTYIPAGATSEAQTQCGMAVADAPLGTWRFVCGMRPNGYAPEDVDIFVDADNRAWLFIIPRDKLAVHIVSLSPDYLRPSPEYSSILPNRGLVCPVAFRAGGRCYLLAAVNTGDAPGPSLLASADTIQGSWTEVGSLFVGEQSGVSFHTRPVDILPVHDRKNALIYIGRSLDSRNTTPEKAHIWLPVRFEFNRPVLRRDYSWKLTDFDMARRRTDRVPPTIPAEPAVTAVSDNTVWLDWQPATDDDFVAGYRVYRDGSLIASVFEPRYKDTTVELDKEYAYTITAADLAGNESVHSLTVRAKPGERQGLFGHYFSDPELRTPVLSRIDRGIDFDWQLTAPDASMSADDFSVRWTGWFLAKYAETCTLIVEADEGVRVWIAGRKRLDAWPAADKSGEYEIPVQVTANDPVEITIEYLERTGRSCVHLYWQSPTLAREIIPAERLRPKTP